MSSIRKTQSRQRRRFAPLDKTRENIYGAPELKGIVFDVDGTLCLPQNYMFREMREALGIPKSVDILDHVRSLSNEPDELSAKTENQEQQSNPIDDNPSKKILSHSITSPNRSTRLSPQAQATAKIQAIERSAMTSQRPQPGLQELMAYLSERRMKKALCTRNFPAPVHHLLDNYLPGEVFKPIITRETEGVQPKPSPEGLWRIARSWGLGREIEMSMRKANADGGSDPLKLARRYLGSGLVMVGDSIDDMVAGHRAGAATVLLVNDENESLAEHEFTDLTIKRLDDLIEALESGFESRPLT